MRRLLSAYRPFLRSRRTAVVTAVLLIFGVASFTSASSYVVQRGDTLSRIAQRYNTTVAAIASANGIQNVNWIAVGQTLHIPEGGVAADTHHQQPVYSGTTYVVQHGDTLYKIAHRTGSSVKAIAHANNLNNVNSIYVGQHLHIPNRGAAATPTVAAATAPDVLPVFEDVPNTPPTSELNPDVGDGEACTRFNFAVGRDRMTGARAGTFIMQEVGGRRLVSWQAQEGWVDSGWITDFDISFTAVHVDVIFYPADGTMPLRMEIVNPAPGLASGWLANGACHAVEIQYPQ